MSKNIDKTLFSNVSNTTLEGASLRVGILFSGGLAAAEFALKYENIKHKIL